jgi:two-component system OmpR family response regulator
MIPSVPKILQLDTDPAYGAGLAEYLEANGCRVRSVHEAHDFNIALASFAPDLVLINQSLRETTGTDVLRALRRSAEVPCIMLTERPDLTDRVVNLEIGADDDLDKSVNPRELLARIRTVLRRSFSLASASAQQSLERRRPAVWRLSVERRELLRPSGTPCRLTSAEFETLRVLYEEAGKPVSRSVLCERVFGRPFRPGDRAIDTVVKKLREKLEPGMDARSIKTVRPIGYVFTGFPSEPDEGDSTRGVRGAAPHEMSPA